MTAFLVDANLPRATGDVIRRHGHDSTDVRDILPPGASDEAVAQYALANGLALITRDAGFGNILAYPPQQYRGIVVVDAPRGAGRTLVLAIVDKFLARSDLVSTLAGRLAVVDAMRVRLRA